MRKHVLVSSLMVTAILIFGILFSTSAFAAKKYKIRWPQEAAKESPWGMMTEKFKTAVEKRTEGAVKVNVFYNGSLAGGQEAMQMVQLGTAEIYMDIIGIWGSAMMSELMVFDMPFVMKDIDHMIAVSKSPIVDELSEKFVKKTGIRILGMVPDQFRVIMSKKPIRNLADIQGVKIRSAEIAG